MRSRYVNVTDRQTDRLLCRSNTALCVASRGENQTKATSQNQDRYRRLFVSNTDKVTIMQMCLYCIA